MRLTTMIAAAAVLLLAGTTPVQAAPYSDAAPTIQAVTVAPVALLISAVQESQSPPDVKVDITTKEGGGTWYTQPLWLAVGGLALLVIILFAVMAGRNNTTVVK
jgi:protein-S-isoprenylcysteine O-methyltransferase Ste14